MVMECCGHNDLYDIRTRMQEKSACTKCCVFSSCQATVAILFFHQGPIIIIIVSLSFPPFVLTTAAARHPLSRSSDHRPQCRNVQIGTLPHQPLQDGRPHRLRGFRPPWPIRPLGHQVPPRGRNQARTRGHACHHRLHCQRIRQLSHVPIHARRRFQHGAQCRGLECHVANYLLCRSGGISYQQGKDYHGEQHVRGPITRAWKFGI